MEWSLVNKVVPLYGALTPGNDQDFVKLGDTVWAFVCDPDDGYRSYCAEVKPADDQGVGPFSRTALAWVTVRELNRRLSEYSDDPFDGFELVDANGHVWLVAGTDNGDNYYPSYTFHWSPPDSPTNV